MERNYRIYVVCLVVIALASGAFWGMKVWNSSATNGDDHTYRGIAMDILQDGQYTFEGGPTNVEPIYPLFLAVVFKVFGENHDAVRVIQIFIFAASILLLFFIAKPMVGFWQAYISSLAAAVFYGLASPATRLHRETILIFLLLSLIYLLYIAQRDRRLWHYALVGMCAGLLILTNAVFQYLPVFIAINMWIISRKTLTRKEIAKRIGVFTISVFLIILPWIVYKSSTMGGVSVASRTGMLLLRKVETAELLARDPISNLIGYGFGYYIVEQFDPTIVHRIFSGTNSVEEREVALLNQGYTYAQTDTLFTREAIKKITHSPQNYVYIVLINFIHLNNSFIPDKDDLSNSQTIFLFAEGRHASASPVIKIMILLGIRFVWFLFFAGVIYAGIMKRKEWSQWSWILLPILYLNIIYSLLHGIPRYSLPIYPLYILLFVIGTTLAFKKYFRGVI